MEDWFEFDLRVSGHPEAALERVRAAVGPSVLVSACFQSECLGNFHVALRHDAEDPPTPRQLLEVLYPLSVGPAVYLTACSYERYPGTFLRPRNICAHEVELFMRVVRPFGQTTALILPPDVCSIPCRRLASGPPEADSFRRLIHDFDPALLSSVAAAARKEFPRDPRLELCRIALEEVRRELQGIGLDPDDSLVDVPGLYRWIDDSLSSLDLDSEEAHAALRALEAVVPEDPEIRAFRDFLGRGKKQFEGNRWACVLGFLREILEGETDFYRQERDQFEAASKSSNLHRLADRSIQETARLPWDELVAWAAGVVDEIQIGREVIGRSIRFGDNASAALAANLAAWLAMAGEINPRLGAMKIGLLCATGGHSSRLETFGRLLEAGRPEEELMPAFRELLTSP